MAKTLYQSLNSASINMETLHENYQPVLMLVKELLGTIPNCDPILEIWPVGFRTYNLLVPNFLNLPNTIFSNRKVKSAVGLAMYASSKAAGCPYCTAHSCDFALRRGLDAEAINGHLTPQERAVVALAEGMARVPADLRQEDCQAIAEFYPPQQVETFVFAVSLMGFLNNFMNGMGIELEEEPLADVGDLLMNNGWHPGLHFNGDFKPNNEPAPKVDNISTYFSLIRQAPGAIILEKSWTRGVPDTAAAANEYLKNLIGYSFPILNKITRKRVILTLTTILRDNLDPDNTEVGLASKCLAAYVFAEVVSNDHLKEEAKILATHIAPTLEIDVFDKLNSVVQLPEPNSPREIRTLMTLLSILDISEQEAAVVILALAASPSPSQVNDPVIDLVMEHLSPAAIVEIMVWISIQQLLHRLGSYYSLADQPVLEVASSIA